jgi:PAS domain S-box-containing protein
MADARGTEGLLAASQELARLGSWELDLRTGHTLWSDEMYRIFGLEPELRGLTQDDLLEFIHPDDRARTEEMLSQVAERPAESPPEGLSGEVRVLRADGAVRVLRFHGIVERDAHGDPARWIGCAQDVTDERLTERELEAHYAVAQALREWESFEEGVMHLLRSIGRALDYPMGTLWLWDDERSTLGCRAFWTDSDANLGAFEYAKRTLNFKPGEGKPGKAWEEQRPVVTPDAITDPVFQPRKVAVAHGVRSGLAFPAVGPNGPLLVLSYYSFDHRLPSPSIVRTLTAIGHELGRFLGTRRMNLGARPLTDREIEVLRLAAEGDSGPQIGAQLFVSPATVKTHFEHIYEKLGVSDRASAVAQSLRLGLIR